MTCSKCGRSGISSTKGKQHLIKNGRCYYCTHWKTNAGRISQKTIQGLGISK